jgi:hypothetical protein
MRSTSSIIVLELPAPYGDTVHFVAKLVQAGERANVQMRCGLAHHVAFEYRPHFDEPDDILDGETGDDCSMVSDDTHEPFGLELTQGLAYRDARHVEVLREFDLVQLLAIRKLPVVYRGAQRGRDVIRGGLALLERRIPLQPLKLVGGDLLR